VPSDLELSTAVQFAHTAALYAARLRPKNRRFSPLPGQPTEPGISVVIPSRSGKELLAAQLPGLARDLPEAGEILVVDNGSDDGTAEWLQSSWPRVRVEVSREPLSFARAVNRGLAASRYSHVCLLNNDMLLDPGFFQPLWEAFRKVPELFCATAQIRFPPGVRREETGKAVMAQSAPEDFPLRCDEPIPGEDLTYVLYGSGGCSLYDAAKLRTLGGIDIVYEPAYVEDLDIGYRAWQCGWPSVYVDAAQVEHRHRATTSRFYSREQLDYILEINYLKFLARSVAAPQTFQRLWKQAINRLRLRAPRDRSAAGALWRAAAIALSGGVAGMSQISEDSVLNLTNGSVWVFPGQPPSGKPKVLLSSPSLDSALEIIRRASATADPILLSWASEPGPPPPALREACLEVILVRQGESLSFEAARDQTVRKWQLDRFNG
jgi:GT2 family glycosyltransferase